MTAAPMPPSSIQAVNPETGEGFILTLDCVENPGIVHAVAQYLLDRRCYIVDIKQFGDQQVRHFFMRVHFLAAADGPTAEELRERFTPRGAAVGHALAAGAAGAQGTHSGYGLQVWPLPERPVVSRPHR